MHRVSTRACGGASHEHGDVHPVGDGCACDVTPRWGQAWCSACTSSWARATRSPSTSSSRAPMARTVFCVKLQREADGLDFAPYPGELGKRLYDNVSKEAWQQWDNLTSFLLFIGCECKVVFLLLSLSQCVCV